MIQGVKPFLIALQFLTILPIKLTREVREEDFGKSLLYFPIIGMLIGLVLSFVAVLFGFLPNIVRAICILIGSIIITGGLHLDGFSDTCDGFYAGKSKEKILEIMRDSRIGVMGVIGITCLLLLKFSLILSIPEDILWRSLVLMAVFARWSQVLACYISSYAHKEGKAKYFIEYVSKKEFIIGSFFTIALFILLMKLKAILLLVFSVVPILLFINYVKKKIDGMTGDTVGATSEIAEVGVLFFILLIS